MKTAYLMIFCLLALAGCAQAPLQPPVVENGIKGEYVITQTVEDSELARELAYQSIHEAALKTCLNGYRARGKRMVNEGGSEKIHQAIECLS